MTDNNAILDQQSDLCPLISIIVPAYNCEKFISKALDSLINQDYPKKNYEIIITDDGSTDSTGKICDDYATKYSFVHVTHTENFGPSHARNIALSKCKGEYITFCDADDFVSPQLISILTRFVELESKADIFCFKLTHKLPKDGWSFYNINNMNVSEWNTPNNEEFCIKILADNNFGGFTVNKIIKRNIALSVFFNEKVTLLEDELWFMHLLLQNKNMSIFCTNYVLYCYVLHNNFGQTRNYKRTYNEDGLSWFLIGVEKELAIENLPINIEEQLKSNLYYYAVTNLYHMGRKMTDDTRKKVKKYISKYAGTYYSKSKQSLTLKIKTAVKYILALFHIHKYR